jgi:hypothetical protein
MLLDLSVVLTRDWLGLAPLEINDRVRYKIADQLMGTQVTYNRNQITSPWMDGAVTVSRQLEVISEPVSVEVWGRHGEGDPLSNAVLQQNMATVLRAFNQDNFTLTIAVENATYAYQCEAADYQVTWTGNRFLAKEGYIAFSVPRQPMALTGGV